MMRQRRHPIAAAAVLAASAFSAAVATDPPEAGGEAARLAGMREQAAAYDLSDRGSAEPLTLRPEPLLRWANVRRESDDGALFLWTLDGRPQAALCVYTLGPDDFHHELVSLADSPLAGRWRGAADWSPEAGVAWTVAAGETAAADGAAGRLAQMRRLARRFEAEIVDRSGAEDETSEERLRLMPQPLYRWSSEASGVVDGAVFAFAQGTDPEVLLLLEARRQAAADGAQWRYALARLSTAGMTAREGAEGEQVWSVPRWAKWNAFDRGEPYINLRRGAPAAAAP